MCILNELVARINGYNSTVASAADFNSGRRFDSARIARIDLAEFFLKHRDEIAEAAQSRKIS